MNLKALKIGQISDIHIGEDESLVQGIDVRSNFLKALKAESMKDIDLLVLSGDLANEQAEPGAYKYVLEQINSLNVPCCIIPGNHDKVEVMKDYFDLQGKIQEGKCYYRYDIQGRSLFFLDSACGEISKEQLEWLKTETSNIDDEVLLFVHHPPCFCNHKFMDLHYHMKNMLEVQSCLSSIKNLKHIFCGHYHFDCEVELGEKTVHVTPSTQMQIDSSLPYFNLKSTVPGWRIIEWGKNSLETAVYFS